MESVIRVVPHDDFTLELWFDTGDHRLFDAHPYLNKGVFVQLQNLQRFKQAFVALDTVCWPGEIDIAPETLYDRSVPVEEASEAALAAAPKVGAGETARLMVLP